MFEMINWTEVIISICSIVITGVLAPVLLNLYKTNLTASLQKTV